MILNNTDFKIQFMTMTFKIVKWKILLSEYFYKLQIEFEMMIRKDMFGH